MQTKILTAIVGILMLIVVACAGPEVREPEQPVEVPVPEPKPAPEPSIPEPPVEDVEEAAPAPEEPVEVPESIETVGEEISSAETTEDELNVDELGDVEDVLGEIENI